MSQINIPTQFCDEHDYGLMAVMGEGAEKFLQGQVTCDIDSLGTIGSRGALCTHQGRVYSTFYIKAVEGGYRLRMSKDIIDDCINRLKKFAVFFKVELLDVSDELQVIFSAGNPVSSTNSSVDENVINHAADGLTLQSQILYEQWLPKNLTKNSSDMQAMPSSWLDLQFVRLGYAEVKAVWQEQLLPHNLGLQHADKLDRAAVSFSKGCYTGQEIVARTQYLGKVKKQLARGSIQQSLLLDTTSKVLNAQGRQVGQILLSSQYQPDITEFLMVANTQDSELVIEAGDNNLNVTLLTLHEAS